jgi:hypothetical protein
MFVEGVAFKLQDASMKRESTANSFAGHEVRLWFS